jgi:hypothetical protein
MVEFDFGQCFLRLLDERLGRFFQRQDDGLLALAPCDDGSRGAANDHNDQQRHENSTHQKSPTVSPPARVDSALKV